VREVFLGNEWLIKLVTEGLWENKLRCANVCIIRRTQNWPLLELCHQLIFNITEEAVGDGVGQVTEPDIAERAVVREALDGEEEGIDNAPSKSTVPFLLC
jgi:hypothetical protein